MSTAIKHSSSNLILNIPSNASSRLTLTTKTNNTFHRFLQPQFFLKHTLLKYTLNFFKYLTFDIARFIMARPILILFYCLMLCASHQAMAGTPAASGAPGTSEATNASKTVAASQSLLASAPTAGPTADADVNAKAAHKSIGISQIVEHPALDEVRQGLITALRQEGFVEGKNLSVQYENAQGNISTSSQIANKLLSEKLDVAVAISTPSAQTLFFAAQKQQNRIPIVFSAVSDPESAKLVSETYPITGVTDAPNLQGLLELINTLMPNLKTLGLMYNPAEANSVSTITKLKKLLKAQGIAVHEVTVNKTADVAQAMHSLIGKVDALYFPQDNTVVAAIETVVNIAQHSSPTLPVILPIFSSDPALLKRGILAAVGFDYHEVGLATGKVVAKILEGEDASKIPAQTPENLRSVVNQSLAKKLGLTLPTKLQHSKLEFID
jgi:putative ABC transport system substrate-binding protein